MFKPFLSLLLCLCLLVPVAAQEAQEGQVVPEGLSLTDRGLTKRSFRSGEMSISIYGSRSVDARVLISNITGDADSTPQAIYEKVNAVRQRLYPKEEIVLEVGPASATAPRTAGTSLWRWYAFWNTRSGWTVWWTQMTVAVMFIDDVVGRYDLYYWGGSSWIYRTTVRSGGAYTMTSYGSWATRGFVARRSGSVRADIVMYFFY